MYSYKLDGISFNDPIEGIEELSNIFERTFGDDNIFREFTETSLTFTGEAFCYLYEQKKLAYCGSVEVELQYLDDDPITLYIILSFGLSDINKRTFQTQLVDLTYRGLLQERVKNEVELSSSITIDCDSIDQIPELRAIFFDIDGNPVGQRLYIDVLDALRFIVKVITNDQIDVQSTYLTNNRYAITTGWSIRNGFNPFTWRTYPTISYEKLFGDLRKLLGLYASLEFISGVPTIVIEREDTFFADTSSGISFPDLPITTTVKVDEDRIFSISELGCEKYKEDGQYNALINPRVNGFALATVNTCGCVFDVNNTQDLRPDLTIDSGAIMSCLLDGENLDDIYLIELDSNGFPAQYQDVITNKYYYNFKLTNPQVTSRWEDIFLGCGYTGRVSDESFRVFSEYDEDNPTCDALGVPVNTRNIFAPTFFRRRNYDNQNLVSSDGDFQRLQPFFAFAACPVTSDTYDLGVTRFTAEIPGMYAFRTSRVFSVNVTNYNINATLFVRHYDSLGNTLAFYGPSAPQNFENIPIVPLTITPLFHMDTGDYVEVWIDYEVITPSTGNIAMVVFDGFFETDNNQMGCVDNIPEGDRIPFILDFEAPLCREDYELLKANRRNYIEVAGKKAWIKRIEYNAKGLSNFELLTREMPDL